MPAVTIDEGRVRHIFRETRGHFADDTDQNRQILVDVASNPANAVGVDEFGSVWFALILDDGRQVWALVRDDLILNGGINSTPKTLPPRPSRNRSR